MKKDTGKKGSLFAAVTALLSVIICVVALAGILNSSETSSTASATVNINSIAETVKININTATKAELMTLPGIGEVKADLIVDNRPYSDKWQVAELEGMGYETIKNIIDLIDVKGGQHG